MASSPSNSSLLVKMGPIMDDAQFRVWKTQLVPLIYDWFMNNTLNWPTQACR